jgi:hypothetical protein
MTWARTAGLLMEASEERSRLAEEAEASSASRGAEFMEAIGSEDLMVITADVALGSRMLGHLAYGQVIQVLERRQLSASPQQENGGAEVKAESMAREGEEDPTTKLARRTAGSSAEQERLAAVRIQSMQRGKVARRKAKGRKASQAKSQKKKVSKNPSVNRIRFDGGPSLGSNCWVSDRAPGSDGQLLLQLAVPRSPTKLPPMELSSEPKRAVTPGGSTIVRSSTPGGTLFVRATTPNGTMTQTITRTSAGSDEYQTAKLRLLGLVPNLVVEYEGEFDREYENVS